MTTRRAIELLRRAGIGMDGDEKLLSYPTRDVAKLRDIYDVVACRVVPGARQSEELAGLVMDDGVVVCPGPGVLRRHFHVVRNVGDGVVATRPKDPEKSRVNAARRGTTTVENPAVGGMEWDDAVRMMRSDLRAIRMNDDELEDFLERRKRMVSWLVGDRPWTRDPSARLRFPLVPAARLRKAWLDYGRTGEVRDPRGVDKITARVLDNIALLHATNALGGHSEEQPRNVLEESGFDDIDPEDESFMDYLTDPDTGGWYVSDYGLPYLMGAYALMLRAGTPEEQLLAVDKALNVVHQRSDLASWFVEGGRKTLNEVSTQS